MALKPAVPGPSEPAPGENTVTSADQGRSGAAPGENTAVSADPGRSGAAPGENTAVSADPGPSGAAPGENAVAVEAAAREPSEPAYDENTAADADPPLPESERARERRGVGWLVTAGVVIVVLAVTAAAVALYVSTHGFRPKTIVSYRPAAVFGLRAGDCINSSPNGLSVTRLSCATPHQAEVFATYSLTGSVWPGAAAVQQQASSGCADRIAGYLNPQLLNAGLIQQFVYPNQKAWQAGERTVICEVSSSTGPLTGSVRQST